jgi:hypothetical protein
MAAFATHRSHNKVWSHEKQAGRQAGRQGLQHLDITLDSPCMPIFSSETSQAGSSLMMAPTSLNLCSPERLSAICNWLHLCCRIELPRFLPRLAAATKFGFQSWPESPNAKS